MALHKQIILLYRFFYSQGKVWENQEEYSVATLYKALFVISELKSEIMIGTEESITAEGSTEVYSWKEVPRDRKESLYRLLNRRSRCVN